MAVETPEEFSAVIEAAKARLPGQPQEAFQLLLPVLNYPGALDSLEKFVAGLEAFGLVCYHLGAHDLGRTLEFLCREPDHPEALFELGYRCYEQRLFGVGATFLAHGHHFHPEEVSLLTELVSCLEGMGLYGEAYRYLKQAAIDKPVCHYLLGFQALMSGKLEEAEAVLPMLQDVDNEEVAQMRDSLAATLSRAKALSPDLDVRGWHLALNGCLLLHVSPYGFDEGMNGRYAFVADSEALCKEGLELLKVALDSLEIEVPRIYRLPERSSQILATAAARFFSAQLVDWPGDEPGLIVAYDLDLLESDTVQSLYEDRPGRILWSHASNWVEPYPWAPDITTFLYQANTTPWQAGRMQVDSEAEEITRCEEDKRPVEELAGRILASEASLESFGGAENLRALCEKSIPNDVLPGWMGGRVGRFHQRKGSPIPSNQFA